MAGGQGASFDVRAGDRFARDLIAGNRSGQDFVGGDGLGGDLCGGDAVGHDLVGSDGALREHIAVDGVHLRGDQLAHVVDDVDDALLTAPDDEPLHRKNTGGYLVCS